uniref:uncharacterized mitochondrial protein AtMg00810-like n=1 Tax=Osmia lignaria TaxID=473952 RepID=UPI0014795506|nr:uncharacterized mitochondrial protein AtMg00810-like [Osmia lignaria]
MNPVSFLGLEIKRMKKGIKISQRQYSTKILETYGMTDAKPADTPMLPNTTTEEKGARRDFPYREAVGSLLYLTAKTRPDLNYAVTYSSRKVQNPTNTDVINVKRALRYLQGTKDLGIVYTKSSDSTILKAYCDADYAGNTESRKSTTGYIVEFCGGPIS